MPDCISNDHDLPLYRYPINPADPHSAHHWQLAYLAGAETVLEVGCASGLFSKFLTAKGVQVTGVEIHPEAARQALAECRKVIVGDIESHSVQSQVTGRFDAVLLGDVIEHLRDPAALLRKVRSDWLKPGGWVVVSVPNSGHWVVRREVLRGRFPARSSGLFDRTHRHFFTADTLEVLWKECGYRVTAQACSVNPNSQEDITFASLGRLYRHPVGWLYLRKLESWLARLFPRRFAYQFILRLQPEA